MPQNTASTHVMNNKHYYQSNVDKDDVLSVFIGIYTFFEIKKHSDSMGVILESVNIYDSDRGMLEWF